MRTIQMGKGWFPEESGGLNRYYRGLTRRLPVTGVAVVGLVAGSDGVATTSGGNVTAFAARNDALPLRLVRARQHLRRAIHETPEALVVSHFALYTAPALDLLKGRPMVVHFHGPWAAEGAAEGAGSFTTSAKHRLESAVYQRATGFVTLSRAFADLLAAQYRIPPERIRVIGGGVDCAAFAPTMSRVEARRRLGWPTDRPIAFVVRRLVNRMGLEDLVAAMAIVRKRVPEAQLMMAGTGALAAELGRRITEAKLDDHVRLLGFVPDDDLPIAYRAADVSIVPSVALEGFGLVVAESLSAGTPVMVTEVGGLPETIRELSPDWILRERTPEALAEALVGAFTGTLAAPSEAQCRDHARNRFDWEIVGRDVQEVYTKAMQ